MEYNRTKALRDEVVVLWACVGNVIGIGGLHHGLSLTRSEASRDLGHQFARVHVSGNVAGRIRPNQLIAIEGVMKRFDRFDTPHAELNVR